MTSISERSERRGPLPPRPQEDDCPNYETAVSRRYVLSFECVRDDILYPASETIKYLIVFDITDSLISSTAPRMQLVAVYSSLRRYIMTGINRLLH